MRRATSQPYITGEAELVWRPKNAAEWQPYFERALAGYAMGQEGAVMQIDVRSVMVYMKRHDYPIENDEQVSKLLGEYFSRFFGPLWDGVKYRDMRHNVGRSLLIGTDNVLDFLKYNKTRVG